MSPNVDTRLAEAIERNAAKIDRFFAGLFLLQWVSRIALAYFRPAHEDDLLTAIFIGAFVSSMPTILVVWKPGSHATRHAIAVAQILYGALLVHLTNGADATQAHILFSLAILALYRDPSVIVSAAIVGIMQAIALETPHLAGVWTTWILCSSAVLFYAARRGREDLRAIAALEAAPQPTVQRILRVIEPPPRPVETPTLVLKQDHDAIGCAATIPPPPKEGLIFSEYEATQELDDLLDGFVSRLHQNAEEVEAAHASGNQDELVLIAHRLRGAAGSFGFMPISQAAGVVEEAALAGGETATQLAALVSLCRRARRRSVLAQAA